MYYKGEGTSIDYEKAIYWFRKAADQNFGLALFAMGQCYDLGRGVKQDLSEAFHWYEKAANQKVNIASYFLGWMYYDGRGTEQNIAKALSYWEQAVSEGLDDARTLYLLGMGYYDAMDAKAVTYLQMSINSSEIDEMAKGVALQKLAACYRFGRCGVTVDDQKADELMKQAAACGNSDAQKIQKWLKSR